MLGEDCRYVCHPIHLLRLSFAHGSDDGLLVATLRPIAAAATAAAGDGGGNKFRWYTRGQFISLSCKESDTVARLSISLVRLFVCLSIYLSLVWSHFMRCPLLLPLSLLLLRSRATTTASIGSVERRGNIYAADFVRSRFSGGADYRQARDPISGGSLEPELCARVRNARAIVWRRNCATLRNRRIRHDGATTRPESRGRMYGKSLPTSGTIGNKNLSHFVAIN